MRVELGWAGHRCSRAGCGPGRRSCGSGGVRPVQLRRGARSGRSAAAPPGAGARGGAWERCSCTAPGRRGSGGPRSCGGARGEAPPGPGQLPGALAVAAGSGSSHPPPAYDFSFCCCRDPGLFSRLLFKVFPLHRLYALHLLPCGLTFLFPQCFMHSQLRKICIASHPHPAASLLRTPCPHLLENKTWPHKTLSGSQWLRGAKRLTWSGVAGPLRCSGLIKLSLSPPPPHWVMG